MQIEIWSDIVCPWCSIGKRRFDKALEQFETKADVQISWRSFELDPHTESDFDGTLNQWLADRKGIALAQAEAMNEHVSDLAAKEGLAFQLHQAKPANTFLAHRLTHYAATRDLRDAMTKRLHQAYFSDGENLNDVETLVRLAREVGLTASAEELTAMLQGDAFAEAVRAEEKQAVQYGIRGVPFFLIDGKFGISGAQATETFLGALRKIASGQV